MFLLDTNVISELRKVRSGRANENVTRWVRLVAPQSLFLCVMVVQELEIGTMLAERRDPAQGALLRAWLETRVLPDFAGRIFHVDLAVTRRSAALHVPNPRPVRDAIIAATSLVHGLTVVTRNQADFESTGVRIFNPWDHQP
jgi:toxin FitB